MKKSLYSSGEFASLFKIKKKTLEHYRNIDLFKPAMKDHNGYFKYSHHQIDTFYTILALKKLNVPLDDIKEYIDERCPELLVEILENSMKKAEAQIYDLQKTRNYLNETINYTIQGITYPNELVIKNLKEEYLILAESQNDTKNKKYQVEFEEATFSPDTSCIGTLKNLNSPNDNHLFIKLYTNTKDHNWIKSSGLYAQKVHQGSHETIDDTYLSMKREINASGFEIGKYAYEEYLIDDLASNDPNSYRTLISIEISNVS